MPSDIPAQRLAISGPSVWTGAQLQSNPNWTHQVTSAQMAIIHAGIEKFNALGLDWRKATPGNLPLGGLFDLFETIRHELEDGSGLFRLRGFPVEIYTKNQLKAFYLSFGDQVGTVVSQALDGQRMMDIENAGAKSKDYGEIKNNESDTGFLSSRARAFSGASLRYHTDRCDVVSLFCVRQASQGGNSKITSAVAVHNAMLERCPELLDELFTPYPRSRFGEEDSDVSTHYMLPVFTNRDGKFATHYSRTYIEAAQTNPDVPRLRPSQELAIDMLAALSEELCYEMTLQPGDIQLLNNHVVYHARGAYVDDAATGRHRLLFRLWMAMPNSRALDKGFEVLFGSTKPGVLRGGIWPPHCAYQLG